MQKNEIKNLVKQVNIVDIIISYLPLKKKGKNHWMKCPFHKGDSGDGSLSVNEEKQFFHCFACKESGDVISFIMKYENKSFIEAIDKLKKYIENNNNKNVVVNEKINRYLKNLSIGINPITGNKLIFEDEESREKLTKFFLYLKDNYEVK